MNKRLLFSLLCFAILFLMSCGMTSTTRMHDVHELKVALPPPTMQPFLPRGNSTGEGSLLAHYALPGSLHTNTNEYTKAGDLSREVYLEGDDNYTASLGESGVTGSALLYEAVDIALDGNVVYLNGSWIGRVSMGLRMQSEFSGFILGAGVNLNGFRAVVDLEDRVLQLDSTEDFSSDEVTVDTTYYTDASSNRQNGLGAGFSAGISIPTKSCTPFYVFSVDFPRSYVPILPDEVHNLEYLGSSLGVLIPVKDHWNVIVAADMLSLLQSSEGDLASTYGIRVGFNWR